MWRILQQEIPDDYVLATGEAHSVREFIELAFFRVGRSIEWKGRDVDEVGIDATSGDTLVKIDRRYFRPTEVDLLLGDPSKALANFRAGRTISRAAILKTGRRISPHIRKSAMPVSIPESISSITETPASSSTGWARRFRIPTPTGRWRRG